MYALEVPNVQYFEQFVRRIERLTKHNVPLYNADITPEQMFLYENSITPFSFVEITDKVRQIDTTLPKLLILNLDVQIKNNEIFAITINDTILRGHEREILEKFVQLFGDPDVIRMDNAFALLPVLDERLQKHNLNVPFHRWDSMPIAYKGGKTFYSYGKVFYRHFAIRLHGRLLVDTSTPVGCSDIDGIVELCQLSGTLFQQLASRSAGAVFQSALVRLMVQRNMLVPFKEKPIDNPMTLFDMVKADRAGQTLDARVGFHRNVAEIDFSSMFPWIMVNKNIGADTILDKVGPFESVPKVPIKISWRYHSLVSLAVRPFLERRMLYKKTNKQRAEALKAVLVSSNGYLRFREFKLGIASAHMAVCAYAREIMVDAFHRAEERGFSIVHGIVDSLYLQKKGMNELEVKEFCNELEQICCIPVSFEGIFKWIVFLPSVNNIERPLPARYYGAFTNGEIKARGIEVRQHNTAEVVKQFQTNVLGMFARCDTRKEIMQCDVYRLLRQTIAELSSCSANALEVHIRLGKNEYAHNVPQKRVLELLKAKGVTVVAGQNVSFVFQRDGVVLSKDYDGRPDIPMYTKMLVRSLFVLVQPFGVTREMILERIGRERQVRLWEYVQADQTFIRNGDESGHNAIYATLLNISRNTIFNAVQLRLLGVVVIIFKGDERIGTILTRTKKGRTREGATNHWTLVRHMRKIYICNNYYMS